MTDESDDAEPWAIDDDTWLDRALPVIRRRAYRSFPFVLMSQEVIAVYRDEIVIVRKKMSVPIPESAYQPDGAADLRGIRGRAVSIPIDQVEKAIWTPRSLLGSYDSLQLLIAGPSAHRSGCLTPRKRPLKLPRDETPNVYRALTLRLGPRFRERRWGPVFGASKLLILIMILLSVVAIIATFAEAETPLNNHSRKIWVATAAFLAFGLVLSIPGRRKVSRKARTKPPKDLSGREPLRLRVAGFLLNTLGSLCVLYYFGFVLYLLMAQMRPGDVGGSLGWYWKFLIFTLFTSGVVTGGSLAAEKAGAFTIASIFLGFVTALGNRINELVHYWDTKKFYDLFWDLGPYIGLSLIYVGRRMLLSGARSAVAKDSRPPVLYLRSFDEDSDDTLTPRSPLANYYALTMPTDVQRCPFPLRVLFELQPLRILRSLAGRVTPTNEVQLATFFRKFGPVVAIGKPGERLPRFGAYRDFVPEAEWKSAVLDYLRRSRYVVLQPAGTKGFSWELWQALSRVEPERLLFSLSNFRGRQNDYEDFRVKAESVHGWRLPRSVGHMEDAQFLFFRADGTPILHAVSYRSPLLWPVLSCVTDLDHTLADFVGRDRTTPYTPRTYPGHGFCAWVLTVFIIPVLGGAFLCLLLLALTPSAPRQDPGESLSAPPDFGNQE